MNDLAKEMQRSRLILTRRQADLFKKPPDACQQLHTRLICRALRRSKRIAVKLRAALQEDDPGGGPKRRAELAKEVECPGANLELIRRQARERRASHERQIYAHSQPH